MPDLNGRAKSRSSWRKPGVFVLSLILLGSVLTLAMGGFVQPETIRMVSGLDHVSPVYGELYSRTTVGYSENFTGWFIGSKSASAEARIEPSSTSLFVQGRFLNISRPASVGVYKNAFVNITSTPILEVRLNVTGGVGYGLRFFSRYVNGTQFNVWWEGSRLDHRPGIGYELIRVNMQRQAFLATGQDIDTLTRFELYVETGANRPTNFRLEILEFNFVTEEIGPMGTQGGYRAVYIDLAARPSESPSWYLNKIQLGLNIVATAGTNFTLHFLDGYRLYTTLDTPSSYVFSPLFPSFNFAFYPVESQRVFPELLPRSGVSMVLTVGSGSFEDVRLNYLDFVFLPNPQQAADFPPETRGLYYTYFGFFLFLLPLGLAVSIYLEFLGRQSFSRQALILVLTVGLACRIALAPMTAHVFDMNIWLASARGWFQYGTPRGSLGPTLPLTFFLYWIPYSFYALIQSLGFQDVFLPSHAAGMLEAVFIKLVPIIADTFLFTILLRFKPGGKTFVWASFYFLNPLAIFNSSVRDHYDSVSLALIVLGALWMRNQKIMRSGLAFVASGMIQLLGFVPYVFLLLKSAWSRQYKLVVGLASIASMVVLYAPQRDQLYKVVLAVSGLVPSSQYTTAGRYSLLGSFVAPTFIASLHPLWIIGGLILSGVSLSGFRRRLDVNSILLYTGLSYLAFLLLLGLINSWLWVLPIGILYAILKGKDSLGAYMLVFGTTTCFVVVSHGAVTSAYYLIGQGYGLLQPWIEGVRNAIQLYAIMMIILAGLLLVHMVSNRNDQRPMLLASSMISIGFYVLVFFWIGVYPV